MISELPPPRGNRALAVDDERLICAIVQENLVELGFEVITAYATRDAVSVLEAGAPFALLVTDIRLPDGAVGWDIARRAREINPAAAVLYISADSDQDWPSRGVPGSVYLRKPFSRAKFLHALAIVRGDVS